MDQLPGTKRTEHPKNRSLLDPETPNPKSKTPKTALRTLWVHRKTGSQPLNLEASAGFRTLGFRVSGLGCWGVGFRV